MERIEFIMTFIIMAFNFNDEKILYPICEYYRLQIESQMK